MIGEAKELNRTEQKMETKYNWEIKRIKEDVLNFVRGNSNKEYEKLKNEELIVDDSSFDINYEDSFIEVYLGNYRETFENNNDTQKYLIRERSIIDYKNIDWPEDGIENWIEEHSKEYNEKGEEEINEDLKEFIKDSIYIELYDNGAYTFNAPNPIAINNIHGYYTCDSNDIIDDGGSGEYEWDRRELNKIGELEEIENYEVKE